MHTGVKRTLAVVSSHYAINLEAVSDGYVLPEDDEEADAEVVKLLEAAEASRVEVLAWKSKAEGKFRRTVFLVSFVPVRV